jgi:hypothetical protein
MPRVQFAQRLEQLGIAVGFRVEPLEFALRGRIVSKLFVPDAVALSAGTLAVSKAAILKKKPHRQIHTPAYGLGLRRANYVAYFHQSFEQG